ALPLAHPGGRIVAAEGATLRDRPPARGRGALVPARRVAVPRLPLVHGGGQPRAERRAPARIPRRGRAALDARVPGGHRGRLLPLGARAAARGRPGDPTPALEDPGGAGL